MGRRDDPGPAYLYRKPWHALIDDSHRRAVTFDNVHAGPKRDASPGHDGDRNCGFNSPAKYANRPGRCYSYNDTNTHEHQLREYAGHSAGPHGDAGTTGIQHSDIDAWTADGHINRARQHPDADAVSNADDNYSDVFR